MREQGGTDTNSHKAIRRILDQFHERGFAYPAKLVLNEPERMKFSRANFPQKWNPLVIPVFKIDAMAPRGVAGEFLGGGGMVYVVWEN